MSGLVSPDQNIDEFGIAGSARVLLQGMLANSRRADQEEPGKHLYSSPAMSQPPMKHPSPALFVLTSQCFRSLLETELARPS